MYMWGLFAGSILVHLIPSGSGCLPPLALTQRFTAAVRGGMNNLAVVGCLASTAAANPHSSTLSGLPSVWVWLEGTDLL